MKTNKIFATMASCVALAGLSGCGVRNSVSDNESAIKVINGHLVDDNVAPGGHWVWPTVNKVQYLRISHRMDSFTITAADKGQNCEKDCLNLSTADQQTVTGSLTAQYHIERTQPGAKRSVMAELYLVRGATDQEDIEEKVIKPAFSDCMIETVNAALANDLVEKSESVKATIKACLSKRMEKSHVVIDELNNGGFGPSQEARASMKKFADARQGGQVADIELKTFDKRKEAAAKNAEVAGAAYVTLKAKGVPDSEIPEVMCLMDVGSNSRPCVRNTATGGVIPR